VAGTAALTQIAIATATTTETRTATGKRYHRRRSAADGWEQLYPSVGPASHVGSGVGSAVATT